MQRDNKIYYYYSKKQMHKEIGLIEINDKMKVMGSPKVKHGLEIHAPNRIYHLQADSEADKLKWIAGIGEWKEYLQTMSKKPEPLQLKPWMSNEEKAQVIKAKVKEVEEKIKKEEKSYEGIEKLITFYKNDVKQCQASRKELKSKEQAIAALKEQLGDLNHTLRNISAETANSEHNNNNNKGEEQQTAKTDREIKDLPEKKEEKKVEEKSSIPSESSRGAPKTLTPAPPLAQQLATTKRQIQDLNKQKKSLLQTGEKAKSDDLTRRIKDLKVAKKEILKKIKAEDAAQKEHHPPVQQHQHHHQKTRRKTERIVGSVV